MGSLFSKADKKVKPRDGAEEKPSSAPSRLECGGLEGTSPHEVDERRAMTPQPASSEAEGLTSPSGKSGKIKKIDVIGKQSDGAQLAAALPSAAVALSDEAVPWGKIFGQRAIRSLFNNDWKDKEAGLQAVTRFLSSQQNIEQQDAGATFIAATQICATFVKDKVAPLYHASLELLRELLAAFCTKIQVAALQSGMDPLMPALLNRCGNLNTRIHEASLNALLGIAGAPNLGTAYVGPYALAPLPTGSKAASASAKMFGRLDLVHGLLSSYSLAGGNPAGLGLKETMEFAKTGLDSPDEKVRTCAIKVIVEMYKIQKSSGQELDPERYLGPLKPALLQMLQRQCADAVGDMGGDRGSGGPAMATGIQIKAGKGGLRPPVRGDPAVGSSRTGLPSIGGLPKVRGSMGRSINASLEVSGKSLAGSISAASVSDSQPCTPVGRPPNRKPPHKPFPKPPSKRNMGELLPNEDADSNGLINSIMTSDKPIRNPSPGGLRPMMKQGSTGSAGSSGSRQRLLREAGPGSQISPSMLDDADESLIMYIAGDQAAPGSMH